MSYPYWVSPAPVNHIEMFRWQANPLGIRRSPTYVIDAPLGMVLSFFTAPLYLYATLSGKFQVWEDLLYDMAKDVDLR